MMIVMANNDKVFDKIDCNEIRLKLIDIEREIFKVIVFMRKCKIPKPLQSAMKSVLLGLRTALFICNQLYYHSVFVESHSVNKSSANG